jgi:hypothetical protein
LGEAFWHFWEISEAEAEASNMLVKRQFKRLKMRKMKRLKTVTRG